MVPEKDPALLLRAFRQVETDQKLVLVGDSSHTDGYMTRLRELAAEDPRVVLVGYQYGEDLAALFAGARPVRAALAARGAADLAARGAAYGLPVLASDIPPHREVLGERGSAGRLVFRAGDLADLTAGLTASLTADPEAVRVTADELREDVVRRYDWDVATDLLEEAYLRARSRRHAGMRAPQTSVPADQPVREVATQ